MKIKHLCFLGLLFSLFSLACQKQTNLNTPSNSTIIYSDTGQFEALGVGSNWQYRQITGGGSCVPDSNGNIQTYADTSFYIELCQGDTIIDSIQYFRIGKRLIHIKNGIYYQLIDGTSVQYMVENPQLGDSWQTTDSINPNYSNKPIIYHYSVRQTNLTLSTSLGTFSGVVELNVAEEVGGMASPYSVYYKAGIGIIKKQMPTVFTSKEIELIQYQIVY